MLVLLSQNLLLVKDARFAFAKLALVKDARFAFAKLALVSLQGKLRNGGKLF